MFTGGTVHVEPFEIEVGQAAGPGPTPGLAALRRTSPQDRRFSLPAQRCDRSTPDRLVAPDVETSVAKPVNSQFAGTASAAGRSSWRRAAGVHPLRSVRASVARAGLASEWETRHQSYTPGGLPPRVCPAEQRDRLATKGVDPCRLSHN